MQPTIEAGAAQLVAFLDESDLEAKLAAARGAVVAAGSGADDDDVVALAHGHISRAFDRFGASYTRPGQGVNKRNMGIHNAAFCAEN